MIVIYILVSLFQDTFRRTIVPNISPLDSHMIGWLRYIALEAGVIVQVGLYVRTMGMVHLNLSLKIQHDHYVHRSSMQTKGFQVGGMEKLGFYYVHNMLRTSQIQLLVHLWADQSYCSHVRSNVSLCRASVKVVCNREIQYRQQKLGYVKQR